MTKNTMKKSLLSTACLVGGNLMVMASLNVDITYIDPSASTLTVELSGSEEVTSTEGNGAWDRGAQSSDIWRSLFNVSGASHLTDSFNNKEYSIVSGNASASVAGGDSIAVSSIYLYSNSSSRSDFSISFAENPNPVFAVGETVVFSGTATVDLGTDTASIFNSGEWSQPSPNIGSSEPYYLSRQFNELGLSLSISQVPEPSAYAAILGCLGLTLALTRRKGRGTL